MNKSYKFSCAAWLQIMVECHNGSHRRLPATFAPAALVGSVPTGRVPLCAPPAPY